MPLTPPKRPSAPAMFPSAATRLSTKKPPRGWGRAGFVHGGWQPFSSQASLLNTLHELDRASAIERTAQEHRAAVLAEDLAVDRHEVALAIGIHAEIAGQHHAAAVGIFFPQR